jgi:phosphate transport system protein
MTKHFQNEIQRLKKKILHLAAMVEENLQIAVTSVMDHDLELARKVIDSEPLVDAQEVEVEEECLKILALHQPVAADLRYIIAVLKINNDLERIADLAVNIAERCTILAGHSTVAAPFDLDEMLAMTLKMVRNSVDALVLSDTQKANHVCVSDDEIDERHELAFRVVQDKIKSNPDAAEYYVSLLSVSTYLERIADHSTNIAEDVIYMIEGEIVRHQGVANHVADIAQPDNVDRDAGCH